MCRCISRLVCATFFVLVFFFCAEKHAMQAQIFNIFISFDFFSFIHVFFSSNISFIICIIRTYVCIFKSSYFFALFVITLLVIYCPRIFVPLCCLSWQILVHMYVCVCVFLSRIFNIAVFPCWQYYS